MDKPRPRRPPLPPPPPEEDDGLGPSRTELRAERQRYQDRLDALTHTLTALPMKRLSELGLDERLAHEIRSLAGMGKGSALARQRRAVATMLREYDVPDLERKLSRLARPAPTATAKAPNAWEQRLLTEGDEGLSALLAAYPDVDRQRLRQAQRAAMAEAKEGKTDRQRKALRALLTELGVTDNADA